MALIKLKYNTYLIIGAILLGVSCKPKYESTEVQMEDITEAVYASGIIKSNNQYKVYSTVNGIIEEVLVSEGDSVKKGDVLFILKSEATKLNTENAALNKEFTSSNINGEKLEECRNQVEIAYNKMILDSINIGRQKKLWQQEIGSKSELEQKELVYNNSRTTYLTALNQYEDLKKQLKLQADQAKNIWKLNVSQLKEYEIRAAKNGVIYGLYIEAGEWAGLQRELALIGDAHQFILSLQVDERDITKIQKNQKLFVSMDSYKNQIFEALVTKINPAMNEKSRTFELEATFIKRPPVLYPNLTAEANIIISEKQNVLTIPRNYLVADSFVLSEHGEKIKILTGLKDYQKVEVLEGLKPGEIIRKPQP